MLPVELVDGCMWRDGDAYPFYVLVQVPLMFKLPVDHKVCTKKSPFQPKMKWCIDQSPWREVSNYELKISITNTISNSIANTVKHNEKMILHYY